MSKRKKLLLFAGASLIILLLHFAATEQKYAGLGHAVEFTEGFNKMIGSSPLWFIDFPYQVLYWRLSGSARFAAPMDLGFSYRVVDQ